MQGDARDGRTLAREAYFMDFANEKLSTARMPLMVTGGIRRIEIVKRVLATGISIAGMGSVSIGPLIANFCQVPLGSIPAKR
jgi:2,4-dienoyl-CoA reductase-like NADH-dependent reductase (Old Yellow Enzyme family)